MKPGYLDGSPVATVILRQGIVTYLNPAAATLAGVPREALLGHPYTEFLSPEDLEKVVERQQARLRGERVPAVYEVAVRVEGRRRTARVHAAVVDGDIVLQLLDVTDEASHGLRLNALAQFGALMQQERSDEDIFRVTRQGMESLGLHCTMVRSAGEGVEVVFVDTDPGRRERWEKALGRSLAGVARPFTPLLIRAWADGSAFTDDYVAEAARFLGFPGSGLFPDGPDLRGVAVRIDVAGRPWALLVAVGDWLRSDDQAALRLFGAQISAALDAARSIQVLSSRNADLAALDRLSTAAGEALDLAAFCRAGSQIVVEAAGCSGLGVYLLGGDGKTIELTHTSGPLAGDHLVARSSIDSPFLGKVLRLGKSVVVQADELPEPAAGVMRGQGVVTVAAVPLFSRSVPNGLLVLGWRERRDAAACRLPLVEAMGAHFAAAVHSQRLVSDLRTRVAELTLLNEMALASATLEPVALLDRMVTRVAETFDAPAGSAYRVVGDFLEPVLRFGVGEETLRSTSRVRVGELTAGLAALQGRTLRFPGDAPENPASRRLLEREGMSSFVAVPLLARERSLGLLVLGRRSPAPFTDAEVSLLSALGAQMGVALENAELAAAARRSHAELAQTQAQLLRQERLAALGELAAVVAHEVRNPLGAIFNSLGALRRMLRPAGDARMLFDIVGEEADRLNRIVGDLLDFARPSKPSIRPEPLAPLLEEVLAAALPHAPAALEVVRAIDPALPPVPADAHQLRQALLNLVQNAVQAMPGGGRLSIGARRDGPMVRLEVADSGPGIPGELREKVFEPFFTTRATGTGLGLAVVRRVALDHRGTVSLEAPPGGGTAVVLRLPLAPPVAVGPDLG